MLSVEAGQVFLAPITVGGQLFDVVIDSGSSDPWLAVTGYTCIDPDTGESRDESLCYFGPAYSPSASSTYRPIPNQNFNVSYADGETMTGSMGYESFTMGGITVPSQEFGVVNYAAWFGDGYSSGLVGFAYSTLTSAYAGNDPHADVPGHTLLYSPLFASMSSSQGVPPVFSLAINRNASNGGVLALGGIPDIPHTPGFTSTPIIPVGVNASNGALVYEFYSIKIGGYAYSSSASTQFNIFSTSNPRKATVVQNQTTTIVDSGTSLIYVPDSVAAGVAASFRPPAYQDPDTGAYFVNCSAKAPVFGVVIGGKIFYVNPLDLSTHYINQTCLVSVQPNGGGLSILGDAWMKNVISVFDIGAQTMRFAAREFYGLTTTHKAASS